MTKIRPSVRKFHSSEYLNALATGEICLVVGCSGDIKQAQKRAAEAKNGVEIGYAIPKEGAQMWFDNLAIPKDARNVAEAHAFIDYLLRPEVAAKNSQLHLPMPTAISRARNSSTRRCSTTAPSIRTPRRWRSLYTITAHDAEDAAADEPAVDAGSRPGADRHERSSPPAAVQPEPLLRDVRAPSLRPRR